MALKTSLLPWPLNLKLKLDTSVDLAIGLALFLRDLQQKRYQDFVKAINIPTEASKLTLDIRAKVD